MAATSALDDLLQDLEGLDGSSACAALEHDVNRFVPRPPATENSRAIANPKAKFVNMRAAQSSMASSKQAAVCQGTDDARDIDKILDLIGSTSPSKLLTGDRAPAASYNGSPAANSRSAVSAGTPTQKHTDAVSATSHTPDGQSVDDFLNDLDSALMPSPKAAQPPSGSSQPPAAALGPSLAPPPLLPSRSAGASMQQRMFPSMGSPPTKLGSDSEHASTGSRSSSFESVTSGHLPLHIGSGLAGRHSAPVVGGSASSSAAPRAGVPMEVIASAASSGKQAKCSRVMLAGSAIARGVKSSAFSKCACDNLRCIQCNFKVMCFMGCKWGRDVDYMFFRNANTNSEKLCEKIYRPTEPGDEAHSYCAYCCQCSWTDVKDEKVLGPASGVGSDQLHWVCAGHPT